MNTPKITYEDEIKLLRDRMHNNKDGELHYRSLLGHKIVRGSWNEAEYKGRNLLYHICMSSSENFGDSFYANMAGFRIKEGDIDKDGSVAEMILDKDEQTAIASNFRKRGLIGPEVSIIFRTRIRLPERDSRYE